jgi:hypothetical protein
MPASSLLEMFGHLAGKRDRLVEADKAVSHALASERSSLIFP